MLYITTAIILWSSLGIFIRMSPLPVHILMFYSNLLSCVLLSPFVLRRGLMQQFSGSKKFLKLLVIGPISLVNTFTFFYAYKHTTIANAILTHYTAPLFVAVMAPFFLHEKLTFRIAASVMAASAGLWIMLDMSAAQFADMLLKGHSNTVGMAAGIFSGFMYAVLVIVLRSVAVFMNVVVTVFLQNMMIMLLLVPFMDFSAQLPGSIIVILVMGIVHSTLAPVLYFRGIKDVTANRAAILGYFEPVGAILLGFVFLGETLTAKAAIGGMMILFSGWLTIIKNSSGTAPDV
ncbi:MAG: DMT family transporter [Nitrospiraceae bacterium]|nr:DMT family transporter [Nitrospiraceae bacterium]